MKYGWQGGWTETARLCVRGAWGRGLISELKRCKHDFLCVKMNFWWLFYFTNEAAKTTLHYSCKLNGEIDSRRTAEVWIAACGGVSSSTCMTNRFITPAYNGLLKSLTAHTMTRNTSLPIKTELHHCVYQLTRSPYSKKTWDRINVSGLHVFERQNFRQHLKAAWT